MNQNTFDQYLSYSPIITRFDIGVYGIRGSKISPGIIAALKPQRKFFKRKVLKDYGWTDDGKIWLGYKISKGLLTGGVFSIPSAMKEFIEGEYNFNTIDGSHIGKITIRNFSGWSVRTFFDRRGGDIGDILILEFDVPNRIVFGSIGGDELIEEYRNFD
jgi:hypothetical protein